MVATVETLAIFLLDCLYGDVRYAIEVVPAYGSYHLIGDLQPSDARLLRSKGQIQVQFAKPSRACIAAAALHDCPEGFHQQAIEALATTLGHHRSNGVFGSEKLGKALNQKF